MTRRQRTINIALWLAQASLASALLFSGVIKITQPIRDVASLWTWTAQYPTAVWLVGSIEILLGLGIVIPELFRIAMRITVWAAYSCAAWVIIFCIFLATQNDFISLGSYLPYLVLTTFIAWGRQKSEYTTPK